MKLTSHTINIITIQLAKKVLHRLIVVTQTTVVCLTYSLHTSSVLGLWMYKIKQVICTRACVKLPNRIIMIVTHIVIHCDILHTQYCSHFKKVVISIVAHHGFAILAILPGLCMYIDKSLPCTYTICSIRQWVFIQ